ncbi:MAG: hypothetical protein CACLOHII_00259 [Candidatus Westeberhardia cardiocondylae]|nr:hypothetical protein [Candidatus Westeberhardia cardiocondylae]
MKIDEYLWKKILSSFNEKKFFSGNLVIDELLKARFLILQYRNIKYKKN